MGNRKYEGYIVLTDGKVYQMSGTLDECIKRAEAEKLENDVEKIVLRRVDDE